MKISLKLLFFVLLAQLMGGCNFGACVYEGCMNFYYLKEIQKISDQTIKTGENLELNLKEYFQLVKGSTDGEFAGYPDINPDIKDTTIATVNYNFRQDDHGENFKIYGKEAGKTEIVVGLVWDGGRHEAYQTRTFKLTVLE